MSVPCTGAQLTKESAMFPNGLFVLLLIYIILLDYITVCYMDICQIQLLNKNNEIN